MARSKYSGEWPTARDARWQWQAADSSPVPNAGLPRRRLARPGHGLALVALVVGVLTLPAARAGNLYLTGHDIDVHSGQNGYDEKILEQLRRRCDGTLIPAASYKIAVIGSANSGFWGWTGGPSGFISAYPVPVFIDADTTTTLAMWSSALETSAGSGIPKYDCLVILSHYNVGGGSLTNVGSANLNLAQPLITTLFNSSVNDGMDIWANSAANVATYYNFLPAGFVTTAPPIWGTTFCATPAGTAIGLTCAMTTGFPTHNQFTTFSTLLTVMERDCASCPATLGTQVISLSGQCIQLSTGCEPQTITFRSGNGSVGGPDSVVTYAVLDPNCGQPAKKAPFVAADLTAATTPAAISGNCASGLWLASLPCDPSAQWIGTNPPCAPRSAVFAVPFNITGATANAQVVLDFCFAVDDGLGDYAGSGIQYNPMGLYLTDAAGTTVYPIPGTSSAGSFAAQTTFTGIDISAWVHPGLNYLYIYDRDAGCSVAGIMFSGQITVSCPCVKIFNERITCRCDGSYDYSFWVKNVSSTPLSFLWLDDPNGTVTFTPNFVAPTIPSGPVPPGGNGFFKTVISGPPGRVCFDITCNSDVTTPETRRHCITLPDCECFELRDEFLMCDVNPGTYVYRFRAANTQGTSIGMIMLIDDPNAPPATFTPASFTFSPPIGPCGSSTALSPWIQTTITSGPGTLLFHVLTLSPDFQTCCVKDITVKLPTWSQPGRCCWDQICPPRYRNTALMCELECAALAGSFTPGAPPPPPPPWGYPFFWPRCLCPPIFDFPGWSGIGPIGDASVSIVGDALIDVGGIGDVGADGIVLEAGPSSVLSVDWLDLEAAEDPQLGAYVEALGYAGLSEDTLRAGLRATVTEDGALLDVDFAPVGATAHHVRVYDGAVLVAELLDQTGSVATAERLLEGVAIGCDGDAAEVTARWSTPVNFTIAGVPGVLGDRVVITAANPTTPCQTLSALALVAADISAITLSGGRAETDASVALPWYEYFDQYAAGSELHGQGGWHGWDGNAGAGALVSDAQAHSTPNSAAIVGASDLVHEFAGATSGTWVLSGHLYVPGDFTSGCVAGGCGSYLLLLNTYADGGPYHWSVRLHADSVTNSFIRDGTPSSSVSLIKDAWVEIEIVIDLDADSYRVFYGGQELGTAGSWSAGVSGDGNGVLNIAALDLYANTSSVVYYDDFSLAPPSGPTPLVGDMNCDGEVGFGDINAFVMYISNFALWEATYHDCPPENGDINGDGAYPSFGDINAFVAMISGG